MTSPGVVRPCGEMKTVAGHRYRGSGLGSVGHAEQNTPSSSTSTRTIVKSGFRPTKQKDARGQCRAHPLRKKQLVCEETNSCPTCANHYPTYASRCPNYASRCASSPNRSAGYHSRLRLAWFVQPSPCGCERLSPKLLPGRNLWYPPWRNYWLV